MIECACAEGQTDADVLFITRWITFIDAAYESASRLLILAASKPDDLFFPEARQDRRRPGARRTAQSEPDDIVDMSARGVPSPFKTPPAGQNYPEEDELAARRTRSDDVDDWTPEELTSEQLIQSETLSEARQDVEEGFRPNISSYVELESNSHTAEDKRRAENEARRRENEARRAHEETIVGFPDLAIFSGADERFSYARAVSRLHEMASPFWRTRKRWTPLLEDELRLWGVRDGEQQSASDSATKISTATSREANLGQKTMGDFADEASYESSTFPARTSSYTDGGPVPYNLPSTSRHATKKQQDDQFNTGPPKISPVHIWGQAQWGPKAGKWGKGPSAENEQREDGEEEGEELRERRARLRKQREASRGAR